MSSAHLTTPSASFRRPEFRFTVSGRMLSPEVSVRAYLRAFFPYIDASQVESVFGFVDTRVPLYGGRIYRPDQALRVQHLAEMTEMGIGLSLPMTNHYFDRAAYEASLPVLAAHHRRGNSVIVVEDEFARQLRQDFPLYTRKASVIKRLNKLEKFVPAFDLYDVVVLPMDWNDDFELLRSLEQKDRVQIFANVSCAYTCPAKICYRSVSRINRGSDEAFQCSQTAVFREQYGMVYFDVDRYAELGFRSFKLVPPYRALQAAHAIAVSLTKASAQAAPQAVAQG